MVQMGVVSVPPVSLVPWHQFEEQVLVLGVQAGVEARVVASGPQAIATVPLACSIEVGTTWHSPQATPFESVPPCRCARWARAGRSSA